MKEIKAIIRPFKLLDVVSELHKIEGLPGLTVSHIREVGKTKAKNAKEIVADELIEYIEKVKIEVVVPDELVERVANTIQSNAHTGTPGDGKIFIYSVDEIVKIRTNERGSRAI